jgi:hypothetical protein
MDSWYYRRGISTGYHHRASPGCRRGQCHVEAQRHGLIQVSPLFPLPSTLLTRTRIPIAVQFAYAIILGSGMLFLPETPRYLVKRTRHDKAARSLGRLRRLNVDHPAIVQELNEIEANHKYELHLGKATYLDCFRGNIGKRLLTGCLLQALQQLTGVNFIF